MEDIQYSPLAFALLHKHKLVYLFLFFIVGWPDVAQTCAREAEARF